MSRGLPYPGTYYNLGASSYCVTYPDTDTSKYDISWVLFIIKNPSLHTYYQEISTREKDKAWPSSGQS